MKVLLNADDVVVAKGNSLEDLGDGVFKANGSIFPAHFNLRLEVVDLLDEDITPQRDKIVGGVKKENLSFDNYLEKEKEKAREEIRQQVKEADKLGNINEAARAKLIEKRILSE